MPNIIIKEYDETKAGQLIGNGFGVVVPGYITPGKSTDCFDENGIYECSSTVDFENNIGLTEQTAQLEAKGPTLELINAEATDEDAKYYNVLSASEFFNGVQQGIVYTRTKVDAPQDENEGRLLKRINDSLWVKYDLATEEDWIEISDVESFNPEIPYEVGAVVAYENKIYKCIKAHEAGDFSIEDFELAPKFSVILKGNEGTDYSIGTKQVGNQIAYLLLKLGYKVYYLRINDTDRLIYKSEIWEPLKDRSVYADVRYLVSGLLDDINSAQQITMAQINSILTNIADQDTGRGDCFALLDIPKSVYAGKTGAGAVTAIKNNLPEANKYSAIFAPTVIYGNIATDGFTNSELPASFHYLACAVQTFDRYPEWYAVSGYQRGVCSLNIQGTSVKFGDAAINMLQQRTNSSGLNKAVNLVIKLGDAYYLWGNRTGYALSGDDLVASHFLNIRQLCSTLKKSIYSVCRNLMFDPNSDILWLNFCNAVRPVLEKMKANQGIKDYRFERKATVKKGKLFAAIRIIPIEAIEDFEIGITLEDNFDLTTISIEETI